MNKKKKNTALIFAIILSLLSFGAIQELVSIISDPELKGRVDLISIGAVLTAALLFGAIYFWRRYSRVK